MTSTVPEKARRSVHRAAMCIALELGLALSGLGQVVQSGAGSVAELVRGASPSVVTVRALDVKGRAIAFGSGFIWTDRRVVTNAHVVAGAAIVEVVSSDGSTLERTPTAEAVSEGADVVILPHIRSQVRGLSLAAAAPSPGDHIVVIGAPEGLSNTVSDGIVSAARRVGERSLLQITAPISHGSSGGPVLNMQGEVVGIATSSLTQGQNLNFAVEASAIRTLLGAAPRRLPFPHDDHARSATAATSAPSGASAQCRDGTYSFSAHRRGTCSHHGGVARWLMTIAP